MTITSYKDLIVWQKSVELVTQIYHITKGFPKSEQFGLTSQIRRAAISIPSNIAEGCARKSRLEYAHFIRIASGSGAELETQLYIALQLNFIDKNTYNTAESLLNEIMRMLNKLNLSLKYH
ncbi:MAG: four helix bundle protein [Patescibacteria group bacterium]